MAYGDGNTILLSAELNVDCMAMNDAALATDLDEARFRAHLICVRADELGLHAVSDAAADVAAILGDPGTEPSPGYGHAMLRLAKLLTPA
ncbi:hypothetical protein [Luteibacter sp.]|uniref:hypothetical protein n=1 Tax=Luteibacter sp. TaxID=1886636 RepID=UPI003F81BDC7